MSLYETLCKTGLKPINGFEREREKERERERDRKERQRERERAMGF